MFRYGLANDAPAPAPAVLTSGVPNPYAMAVDGQNLYWTNSPAAADGGAVVQVSLTTGDVTTLVSAAQDINGNSIAVDSRNVYASVYNSLYLVSVPIGGGTISTLMTYYYESTPVAVAGGAVLGVQVNSGVWAVPVDGGAPVNYVQQPYGALTGTTDGTTYFWVQSATPNAIRSAPLGGSMPSVTQLVTDPPDAGNQWPVTGTAYQNLAVDGTSVYFFDNGTGQIFSVPKAGGAFEALTSVSAGNSVQSLLTDGVTLYWAQTTPPAIVQMPVGGGTPQTIVSGAAVTALATLDGSIPCMALDAQHLYWFNPPDIDVMAR